MYLMAAGTCRKRNSDIQTIASSVMSVMLFFLCITSENKFFVLCTIRADFYAMSNWICNTNINLHFIKNNFYLKSLLCVLQKLHRISLLFFWYYWLYFFFYYFAMVILVKSLRNVIYYSP